MNLPKIQINLPPLPQTTTILALGFLAGILLYMPMLAWLGDFVPAEYREEVAKNGQLFRDGMLLILGYYFAKVVNAGQERITHTAIAASAAGGSGAGGAGATAEAPAAGEPEARP